MTESGPPITWEEPPAARSSWVAANRRWLWILLAVAGVGGLLAIALAEGFGPSDAAPKPLDVSVDGIGLALSGAADWTLPTVVIIAVGALALLGLAGLALDRRWTIRLVGVAGMALVIGAGVTVWMDDPLDAETLWVDGVGHATGPTEAPFRFSGYELAPGEPGTFGFVIRNGGALPISILGYADEPVVDGIQTSDAGARIVGLGRVAGGETKQVGERLELAQGVADWPIRLEPGGRVALVVVIRGGPCASGTSQDDAPMSAFIGTVRVVYRVAGWTRVSGAPLPVTVTVPTDPAVC